MVVKHCCYGECRSDSRHSHLESMKGVFFINVPKPKREPEKCARWVQACSRENFTVQDVKKDVYICSLHFVGRHGPTKNHPDPIPATYNTKQVIAFFGLITIHYIDSRSLFSKDCYCKFLRFLHSTYLKYSLSFFHDLILWHTLQIWIRWFCVLIILAYVYN